MMLPAELKENILQDTDRHTGLILEADGICYPAGEYGNPDSGKPGPGFPEMPYRI